MTYLRDLLQIKGPLDTLVITDGLVPPLDEAGTIMAVNFISSLSGRTVVLNRARTPFQLDSRVHVVNVSTGESVPTRLVSYLVFALISLYLTTSRRPTTLRYLPLRAPDVGRQLHARLMSIIVDDFCELLFQIPHVSTLQRRLMTFAIKVPSETDRAILAKAGVREVSLITPKAKQPFKVVYDRAQLRAQYGFATNDRVVSHVGHLTPGRGLDFVLQLAERRPGIRWLLVVSSRAQYDLGPVPKNVTILQTFVEDIYEIYHLSDGYIFPVKSEGAAVSTPLSLLEAAQAKLPIICSDLPHLRSTLGTYSQVLFIDMRNERAAADRATKEIDHWGEHE